MILGWLLERLSLLCLDCQGTRKFLLVGQLPMDQGEDKHIQLLVLEHGGYNIRTVAIKNKRDEEYNATTTTCSITFEESEDIREKENKKTPNELRSLVSWIARIGRNRKDREDQSWRNQIDQISPNLL